MTGWTPLAQQTQRHKPRHVGCPVQPSPFTTTSSAPSVRSTGSTKAEANTALVRGEDQRCDCLACNSPSPLWSSQNDTSESCPRRPRSEDQCTHPPPLSPKRKKAASEKRDSNRNRIRRKNCVYFISGHAQKLRVGLPKAPEVERSHEDGSEQRKTGELSEALWKAVPAAVSQ